VFFLIFLFIPASGSSLSIHGIILLDFLELGFRLCSLKREGC